MRKREERKWTNPLPIVEGGVCRGKPFQHHPDHPRGRGPIKHERNGYGEPAGGVTLSLRKKS